MSTIFLSALAALSVVSCGALRVNASSGTAAYEAFLRGVAVRRGDDDAVGYSIRRALFEQRRREVHEHNAQPGILWRAAVNKFADYTHSELQALLGHRPGRRVNTASAASVSLTEMRPALVAETSDWSAKLNASRQAKDQGSCGSCWAVAAAGAIESFLEMAGTAVEVSYEELVDCTPNPDKCGGAGKCDGCTAELAFDFFHKNGLVLKKDYQGYQSGGDGTCRQPSTPSVKSTGFTRLDTNKLQPMLEALNQGPVVVSADAGPWGSYSSGVFDGCEQDAVINHAILMMGYGKDEKLGKKYWLIRNSWGGDWGEKGFIRLLRHDSDAGDAGHCGTDRKPLDGVGCVGGDKELPVCGMCGILSDSAYPTGVALIDASI